jgi:hypothetical protein
VGDKIFGRGGDDRICVNPSDAIVTLIRAGDGDDHVHASSVVYGGDGDDRLIEPDPDDPLIPFFLGGKGDDLLRSRADDINAYVPGAGDDRLVGAAHAGNIVWFRGARRGVLVDLRAGTAHGQGADTLRRINVVLGSSHSDFILGGAGVDELEGLRGDDVLVGRRGDDFLQGRRGSDRLNGGPGGDYAGGDQGRDALLGRAGDDVVLGDRGEDALYGGAGADELIEKRAPEPNLILAGPGRDTCYGGYRVPPNIERGCERHAQPKRTPQLGPLVAHDAAGRLMMPTRVDLDLTGPTR